MRELILNAIEERSTYHKGFSKDLARWRNVTITVNGAEVPIYKIDFNTLNDVELLDAHEKIIYQHYKWM